jgi:hypothetical protein
MSPATARKQSHPSQVSCLLKYCFCIVSKHTLLLSLLSLVSTDNSSTIAGHCIIAAVVKAIYSTYTICTIVLIAYCSTSTKSYIQLLVNCHYHMQIVRITASDLCSQLTDNSCLVLLKLYMYIYVSSGEELSWKHLSEGIFPTASVNTLQSDLSKVCTRDTAMEQAALDIGVSPLDEVFITVTL